MGRAEAELFAGCHWLFVNGMRASIEARLRAVYGDGWWVRGVMPGVSGKGENRSPVEQLIEQRPSLAGCVDALDAAAIRQVVYRNYGFAFNELFSEGRKAYRDMGRIVGVRNEWAHGREVSDKKMLEAIDLMQDALALMDREESIKIARLRQAYMDNRGANPANENEADEETGDVQDVPGNDVEFTAEPPGASLLSLWGDLRSFLSIESEFADAPRRGDLSVVAVRVTNTAPVSDDMPLLRFLDVRASVGTQSIAAIDVLEPGQSIDGKYECLRTAVAGVRFKVECRIDRDSLLRLDQTGGFAPELVNESLDGFIEDFDEIGIKAFIEDCKSIMSAINADMSLADASVARERIDEIRETALEKLRELGRVGELYGVGIEARESGGHPFWRDCRALRDSLRAFRDDLEGLHKAIGETDMVMLDKVVKDLTGQQMAIMRVEALIRDYQRE